MSGTRFVEADGLGRVHLCAWCGEIISGAVSPGSEPGFNNYGICGSCLEQRLGKVATEVECDSRG